jgi:hypothetical protein
MQHLNDEDSFLTGGNIDRKPDALESPEQVSA